MRLVHTLSLLAVLAVPSISFADTINVFNTGASVTGGLDNNYTVSYTNGSINLSTVGATQAYSIVANPGWTSAPSGSTYIGPTSDAGTAKDAGGYYTYTTTFTLNNFNTNTFEVSGLFAADNAVPYIYLNGVLTPFSNLYSGNTYGYGFAGESAFDLTSGFVAGTNTLQFIVQNGNFGTDTAGPTGLLVSNVSGTATALTPGVTPEPSSMMLLGTGLFAVAALGRRKFLRA